MANLDNHPDVEPFLASDNPTIEMTARAYSIRDVFLCGNQSQNELVQRRIQQSLASEDEKANIYAKVNNLNYQDANWRYNFYMTFTLEQLTCMGW